jgi:Protein of unknown function (DUF4019)
MKRILLYSILCLISYYQQSFASNAISAIEVADKWLADLDEGKLDKCYESASPLLKDAVNQKKFILKIKNAQKEIGSKVVSRDFLSMTHKNSLPGVPTGNYMVIQYNSLLSNGKKALEIITPMMDDKNKYWKVAGYYIYKR